MSGFRLPSSLAFFSSAPLYFSPFSAFRRTTSNDATYLMSEDDVVNGHPHSTTPHRFLSSAVGPSRRLGGNFRPRQGAGFLRSWPQRAFFGMVLFEVVFILLVTSLLITDKCWKWHLDNFTRVLYGVYVSMLFLTLDALYRSNFTQILGISLFNLPMLVYSIFQRINAFDAVYNDIAWDGPSCPRPGLGGECNWVDRSYQKLIWGLTAAPIVIGISQIVYGGLSFLLMKEFGWDAFRLLGGDLKLKRYYNWDLRLQTILKVDFFFFSVFAAYNTIFGAQGLRDENISDTVKILCMVVLIVQYFVLFSPLLGLYSLSRELALPMYAALTFLSLGTGFLIPGLWLWVYGPILSWDWYSQSTRVFMIVLSSVDGFLALLTVLLGIYVSFSHFGEGLLEAREQSTSASAARNHIGGYGGKGASLYAGGDGSSNRSSLAASLKSWKSGGGLEMGGRNGAKDGGRGGMGSHQPIGVLIE